MPWALALFALGSTFCIQVATNLFNDAIDSKKGTDTRERLGPTRVTSAGLLSERQVMGAACGFALAAVALGVPIILQGGWPILVLGVLSLAFAYGYTGGPLPLAYNGLGEVFVILFFGLAAVVGLSFVILGRVESDAWILGLQMGILAANLISVNNLRDVNEDRKNNKRTLAVLWGPRYLQTQMIVLTLLCFALVPYWKSTAEWAGVLPFATLPLALSLFRGLKNHAPSVIYNQFLAKAAALQFLFSLALGLGFLWG